MRYLRDFPTSFSDERWGLWKERFEFLQSREGLKQGTRDSTREALGRMKEFERLESEPQANLASSLPQSGLRRVTTKVQVHE